MVVRRRAVRAVALCVFSTACSRSARPDEVPGTYVMNKGRGADTLVVHAGGTYVRRYTTPGQRAVTDTGSWSVETVTGDGNLAFERFPVRWRAETFPGRLPDTLRGLWVTPAERSISGTVRLVVDDDRGWAYIQVARP